MRVWVWVWVWVRARVRARVSQRYLADESMVQEVRRRVPRRRSALLATRRRTKLVAHSLRFRHSLTSRSLPSVCRSSQAGQADAAETMLREVISASGPLDASSFNSLLHHYAKQSQPARAMSIISLMQHARVSPSLVTFNSLASAYAAHGDLEATEGPAAPTSIPRTHLLLAPEPRHMLASSLADQYDSLLLASWPHGCPCACSMATYPLLAPLLSTSSSTSITFLCSLSRMVAPIHHRSHPPPLPPTAPPLSGVHHTSTTWE